MIFITVFFNSVNAVFRVVFDVIRSITIIDFIDILFVGFMIFGLIELVRDSRAMQLIKGILLLLVAFFVSYWAKLDMVNGLLSYFFQFALIAVMIVFQPEIRKALESIGRNNIGKTIRELLHLGSETVEIKETKDTIDSVCEAVSALQRLRMGALIIFERKTMLGDIAESGTIVDAKVSAELVGNIFFNKAPLHDGAMIIRDNRIHSAGCILPLTKNNTLNTSLGTRHRAGLGMSEESDAVVVVVSEETAEVRIAVNGQFTPCTSKILLKELLETYLIESEEKTETKKSSKIRGLGKDE